MRWLIAILINALYAASISAQLILPNIGPYGAPINPYADGFWRPGIRGVAMGTPITTYSFAYDPTVNITGTNITVPTDGVSDCTAALNAAMGRLPASNYTQLPAGTFNITNSVFYGAAGQMSYKELRGTVVNGSNATHIVVNTLVGTGNNQSGNAFVIGNDNDFIALGIVQNTINYGTTEVDVPLAWYQGVAAANSLPFPFSGAVAITNDPTVVNTIGYSGNGAINNGSNAMAQLVVFTNLITNGATLEMFANTPFYYHFDITNKPVVQVFQFETFYSGIRDLQITFSAQNAANANGAVNFFSDVGWWAYNVIVTNFPRSGILWNQCTEGSVLWCGLDVASHNASGQGYGYHSFGANSDVLIANNYANGCRHSIIFEGGGTGSAACYNYLVGNQNTNETFTSFTGSLLTHAACPYMLIAENNFIEGAMYWGDFQHGNAWGLTAFRNWVVGGSTNYPPLGGATNYSALTRINTTSVSPIWDQQTNYDNAFVNNVLGDPYYPNYPAQYTNAGINGTFIFTVGKDPSGPTLLDPTVWNTLFIDGNLSYDGANTNGTLRFNTNGARAYNPSAVFTNGIVPGWSNGLVTVPPFGGDVQLQTNTLAGNFLPAALRYFQIKYGINVPLNNPLPLSGWLWVK